MDENLETFVVYILALQAIEGTIYPSRIIQIAVLQWDMAPTKILVKYTDNTDVFLFNLIIALPNNIVINKYTIELVEKKHISYISIYTFSPVELETLKI